MLFVVLLAYAFAFPSAPPPPQRAPSVAMTLAVDATDAPMKILHATATMPARAGSMTYGGSSAM